MPEFSSLAASPPIRPWHHLTIGLTVATLHMLYYLGWSVDDPHITFCYVDHWASGHGLVFNIGEAPIEGFSNFLWIVALLPWRWLLGADALLLGAQVMGFACALATGPLLAWLWQRTGPPAKDAAPLWRWLPLHLWALSGPAMLWGVGGLETPLVALLITALLAGVGADWHRRPQCAPLLAGLALLLALARPEGAMFGLALFAVTAWRRTPRPREERRAWLIGAALFLAGLGLYHLWRWHTFGSLVPNTAWAKMGGSVAWRLRLGGGYLVETTLVTAGLPVVAWLGLWAWPRSPVIRIAALFTVLQLAFILWVGGDWMPCGRFLAPVVPCLLLLETAGLRRAWDGLTAVTRTRWLRDLLILALLLWQGASLIGERHATREYVTLLRADALLRKLHETVLWLEAHAEDDDTVAGEEAGLIPFVTQRRFLDLLAINDAHLARQPGPMHGKMDVPYVVDQWRPDWVLLLTLPGDPVAYHMGPDSAGGQLGASEAFQTHYTEVHQIPRQWGTRVTRIYRRNAEE